MNARIGSRYLTSELEKLEHIMIKEAIHQENTILNTHISNKGPSKYRKQNQTEMKTLLSWRLRYTSLGNIVL